MIRMLIEVATLVPFKTLSSLILLHPALDKLQFQDLVVLPLLSYFVSPGAKRSGTYGQWTRKHRELTSDNRSEESVNHFLSAFSIVMTTLSDMTTAHDSNTIAPSTSVGASAGATGTDGSGNAGGQGNGMF